MKIAVSAEGNSLDSNVDMHFGRCAFFLIVDIKDDKVTDVKVIKNEGSCMSHGAGLSAGEIIGNEGAEKAITGNLGPKAARILEKLGIQAYQAEGKAEEAVNNLIKGRLKAIGETVGEHSGICSDSSCK